MEAERVSCGGGGGGGGCESIETETLVMRKKLLRDFPGCWPRGGRLLRLKARFRCAWGRYFGQS